jgi:hypothetical protein
LQAKEWRQALQMSYAHNRPDLVDTLVIPAAAAAAALLMDDAKESTTKLAKYLGTWLLCDDCIYAARAALLCLSLCPVMSGPFHL